MHMYFGDKYWEIRKYKLLCVSFLCDSEKNEISDSEKASDKICFFLLMLFIVFQVTGRIIQYVSCVDCKGPVHISCIPGNKLRIGRIDYLFRHFIRNIIRAIFQYFQKQHMFWWTRTMRLFTIIEENAQLWSVSSETRSRGHTNSGKCVSYACWTIQAIFRVITLKPK